MSDAWMAHFKKYQRHAGKHECEIILDNVLDGLRCDRFGDVCWFYWFNQVPPSEKEMSRIAELTDLAGASDYIVHMMYNRGSDAATQKRLASNPDLEEWAVVENGLTFLCKANQGQSAGLFIDHVKSRKLVASLAKGKSLLNLFSYTAAFGVHAAAGGAERVVNVDTSKATLEWAKENASYNDVDMEYVAMDAREYLTKTERQSKKFDIIVCDPPSFARSKKGVFKIEKDLPEMISQMVSCASDKGKLLISCNYEAWGSKKFKTIVSENVPCPHELQVLEKGKRLKAVLISIK